MSAKVRSRVRALESAAQATDEMATAPRAAARTTDAGVLAGEFAAAFRAMVELYRKEYKMSHQDAVARAEEPNPGDDEHALNCPPEQLTWYCLEKLSQGDPERSRRRWEEVKQAALGELRSGHRSARAV